MGTVFCQLSGLWELHCEPSNLILNFLSYWSQFHGFHYLHGLLFSQHFKHNIWLVVKLDETRQGWGGEGLSWSPPGVCRPGPAQAGQGQGWAAGTLLTERSTPSSPATEKVFGVTSVRNDVSLPSCTTHQASSSVLFVSTPLHFVWNSFETCSPHSFLSAVLCCLEVLSSFL